MIYTEEDFKFTDLVKSYKDRLLEEWKSGPAVNTWVSMNTMADDLGQTEIYQGETWKVSPHRNMGYRIYPETAVLYPVAWELLLNFNDQVWGAGYSCIEAHAEIKTHKDRDNRGGTVRIHIPLVIPEGDIGIQVNDVKATWNEDTLFIFDNSQPHSVWNNTDENRIIFLFDLPKEYCLVKHEA